MSKRVGLALVILCLALALAGCQAAGSPKTRKVLAEWSRGQQVGITALNQRVDMVSDDDSVHLVWVAGEGRTLHYCRLDSSGQVQINTDLPISGAHPSAPRLAIASDGSVRVLWTDNPRIPRALFLARVTADGLLLHDPQPLSTDGVRVSDFELARNADDTLDIFWATEVPTDGGIYHLRLSADDQVVSANRLLLSNGSKPTLQIARDGKVHLAWVEGQSLQENNVYYAAFDSQSRELTPKTRVGFYRAGTGVVSYAPVMGLDSTTVYLFWASEARGGRNAGEAQTFGVSFPLGAPAFTEASTVDIPSAARPTYHSTSGSLPYRQLASVESGGPTAYLYMPATLAGQRDELGVFLVGQVATRNRSSMQVMWVIHSDGEAKGYQLPENVDNSMRPTGAIDSQGNVHLAWLSAAGFGQYDVHYASTSPTVRANLDRVTVQDLAMEFLDAVWNLAPAMGFFPPIFLLWSIASFVWVVVFYLVKVEGGLERRVSQIALVIAILLYLFSKFFLMPGVLFYAPFVDRVPENLQYVPVLGTLAVTTLAALGAVALYSRKRQYGSLFVAYLLFVVTDAVLSLIIYVPGWLGA